MNTYFYHPLVLTCLPGAPYCDYFRCERKKNYFLNLAVKSSNLSWDSAVPPTLVVSVESSRDESNRTKFRLPRTSLDPKRKTSRNTLQEGKKQTNKASEGRTTREGSKLINKSDFVSTECCQWRMGSDFSQGGRFRRKVRDVQNCARLCRFVRMS
jgi:hypothetical protein